MVLPDSPRPSPEESDRTDLYQNFRGGGVEKEDHDGPRHYSQSTSITELEVVTHRATQLSKLGYVN